MGEDGSESAILCGKDERGLLCVGRTLDSLPDEGSTGHVCQIEKGQGGVYQVGDRYKGVLRGEEGMDRGRQIIRQVGEDSTESAKRWEDGRKSIRVTGRTGPLEKRD